MACQQNNPMTPQDAPHVSATSRAGLCPASLPHGERLGGSAWQEDTGGRHADTGSAAP